uniref:Neural cell adhesion molecule 3 n=1 Tax=Lepisosteus oculatus TaxID=7918 RepID=W5M7D3_LEPOC
FLEGRSCCFSLSFLCAGLGKSLEIVSNSGDVELENSHFMVCKVSARGGEGTITWHKDEEEIEDGQDNFVITKIDEVSSKLTIKNARREDGGTYICSCEFEDGIVKTAKQTITIIMKPKILTTTSYYEFLAGKDATMPCEVTGIPMPTVTWKFKDRGVIDSTSGRISILPGNSLQIQNISRVDHGTYVCEAWIKAKERNEVAKLSVSVVVNAPPHMRTHEQEKSVAAGPASNVSLTCPVSGHPPPSISWASPERSDQSRYQFNSDHSELIIHSVSKNDEGVYNCTATNAFGTYSSRIVLGVSVRPDVQQLGTREAQPGETVSVTCQATGDPTPTIHWVRKSDGQILTRRGNRSVETCESNVRDQQASDTRAAKTWADAGQALQERGRRREGKRSLQTGGQKLGLDPFPGLSLCLGLTAVSLCRCVQRPGDRMDIREDTRSTTFTLRQIVPSDGGMYTCIASNTVGKASQDLSLQTPPAAPQQVRAHASPTSVRLSLDAPLADGGSPLLQLRLQWREVAASEWRQELVGAGGRCSAQSRDALVITGLQPYTSYSVQLSAINGVGEGNMSQEQTVRTVGIREPDKPVISKEGTSEGNTYRIPFKQLDDGGKPIIKYIVRYRSEDSQLEKEMELPADSKEVILKDLDYNTEYGVEILAVNSNGTSAPANISFLIPQPISTKDARSSPQKSGMGTGGIVGIVMVIFLVVLIAADATCFYTNRCGMLMCIAVNLLGRRPRGTKGLDPEE